MLSTDTGEMMKNWSHLRQKETKEKLIDGRNNPPQVTGQLGSPRKIIDQSQRTACPVERSLAIVYMYIGVSCPVRSLNMAAGMVFMWIWQKQKQKQKKSIKKVQNTEYMFIFQARQSCVYYLYAGWLYIRGWLKNKYIYSNTTQSISWFP